MAVPEIDLDLSLAPAERWRTLGPHAEAARRLLDCYLRDLSQLGSFAPVIESYADAFVEHEYRAEIASIAKIVGRPENDVLLGSLYYDAFRQLIGCTAFACDGPDGPIHARNLDWWTEDKMLARLTCLVNAHGGNVPRLAGLVTAAVPSSSAGLRVGRVSVATRWQHRGGGPPSAGDA